MSENLLRIGAAAAALALLGACASGIAQRQSQVRDRYDAYAGPPVDHFTWLGRYDSWEPIAKDELVVFTTPWDAYLLKVWPTCPDLLFARDTIGLTSTSGAVYARLDSVYARHWRCPIQEIRRIDYRRMKADLRLDAQPKGNAVR
jgi:hypothetical protein